MNIKGKVIKVLPEQTGQGKNGEWKKQEVIIETEGQYPKKVCVSLWGDKVGTVLNGAVIDASIDPESREYNGRWYTELRAWKVDAGGGSTQQSVPSQPSASAKEEDTSDLPF